MKKIAIILILMTIHLTAFTLELLQTKESVKKELGEYYITEVPFPVAPTFKQRIYKKGDYTYSCIFIDGKAELVLYGYMKDKKGWAQAKMKSKASDWIFIRRIGLADRYISAKINAIAEIINQPYQSVTFTSEKAYKVIFKLDIPIKQMHNTINQLKKKAENGDPSAQDTLGSLYTQSKAYQRAFNWTKKAADQGYAKAEYHLGEIYAHAQGVEKDNKKAIEWYTKSANKGFQLAKEALKALRK